MRQGQSDQGSIFARGFALGLFGSFLGLLIAPILNRDWVPAAAVGAGVNLALISCLGVVDYLNPGDPLFGWVGLMSGPDPVEAGIPVIVPGEPSPQPAFPAGLAAIGCGALLAMAGGLGAVWLYLDPEGEAEQGDGDPGIEDAER